MNKILAVTIDNGDITTWKQISKHFRIVIYSSMMPSISE